MNHFDEFLITWSLRSNSVTRQLSFNRTKIGGKCQNSNTTFWEIFKQCELSSSGICMREPSFISVYGWCHEVWPSKKAPFVNNNLCWPRPTEKRPFFLSSWISRATLYNCTQQTCGPEQKNRPNPSIACCINCPKKSFGETEAKKA